MPRQKTGTDLFYASSRFGIECQLSTKNKSVPVSRFLWDFRIAFGFTVAVLGVGVYLTLRIRRFLSKWAVGAE